MKKPDKRIQNLLRVKREGQRLRKKTKGHYRVSGKKRALPDQSIERDFWRLFKWR